VATQPVEAIQDSALLSRSELEARLRRVGAERYHHQHPFHAMMHEGKLSRGQMHERWIRLAEATGLERERVIRYQGVLPAVRYAVDAYLDLVKNRSFLEAVASSLTELFSRDLIALRMDRLRQHYPWLSSGLDYFTARLHQAPEDAQFALRYVIEHAHTRAEQELAIGALQAKCDILWAQLDALYYAYVQPGWPPPGAFRMES
jgi:pyrroloquinoline-quinone synthase